MHVAESWQSLFSPLPKTKLGKYDHYEDYYRIEKWQAAGISMQSSTETDQTHSCYS